MSTNTSRSLQFAFALVYSVFLVAGAIPYSWLPLKWQPGFTEFTKFQFQRFRIVPGLGVFNFSEEFYPLQPIGGCVKVEVKTIDGRIERSNDYPCPLQKKAYSVHQDPLRSFFLTLTNFAVYQGEKVDDKNPFARAVGEYYCRKFGGEKATVQFTIYYQDLLNRSISSLPMNQVSLDCAILRSSS